MIELALYLTTCCLLMAYLSSHLSPIPPPPLRSRERVVGLGPPSGPLNEPSKETAVTRIGNLYIVWLILSHLGRMALVGTQFPY